MTRRPSLRYFVVRGGVEFYLPLASLTLAELEAFRVASGVAGKTRMVGILTRSIKAKGGT